MKSLLAALFVKDSFSEFAETVETIKRKARNVDYVRDIRRQAISAFNTTNLIRRHIPCKPSKKP